MAEREFCSSPAASYLAFPHVPWLQCVPGPACTPLLPPPPQFSTASHPLCAISSAPVLTLLVRHLQPKRPHASSSDHHPSPPFVCAHPLPHPLTLSCHRYFWVPGREQHELAAASTCTETTLLLCLKKNVFEQLFVHTPKLFEEASAGSETS